MGSEDEQVKAVFASALERPAEARAAWLARVCRGNSALRRRVETLLDAHERAGGFMEDAPPASAPDAVPTLPEEQPGAFVGQYKILQKIGEGGFGAVYMAEQTEPVVRRVALKVIKLGMDTKQVVARFDAERQALAMMDHPNIAKVLDAGATASGRPYFVMELVKGVPITEYCDTANLPTAQRLDLFAQVCGALQHAHQKGVIHRDVKPGNVLVTLHDGVPVPKVIDFGIAKATDHRLTEKTLFTEFRQVIGTPEYMSPEQAENSGLDVDTRSDVYSLGVLLYELLTATTPFDAATLRAKGYGEMLRIIREDDPPPPSTRIATLGDRLAVVARLHGVAPELLSRRLRGDLDWIVMKCLDKDRSRRYETASALAADVRRHLDDEPVAAGPPGAGYRVRKFVRRHRAQVVAAGVVLAVLALGGVGTTLGMWRARSEKRRADEETARAMSSARAEEVARIAAEESEKRAVEEARRAEAAKEEESASRRRAETISQFVTTALKSSDPEIDGGGQDMTILAAMDNAVADIDSGRFAHDPAAEAALKDTIGLILLNNGRRPEAEKLLTQALATQRRLAAGDSAALSQTMNNLALVLHETGRTEEARRLFVEALEMDRRLHPGDHELVAIAMMNLASAVTPDEADSLVRDAMAMRRRLSTGESRTTVRDLNQLGFVFERRGRTAEAEPLYAEALEVSRRVCKGDDPLVAIVLDNLGKARSALGRGAEGAELLTQALAMRRRLFKSPHPDLATGVANLAAVLRDQKRWAEAEPLSAEALEMNRQLVPGDSSRVCELLFKLSMVRRELGRTAEAERVAAEALAMAQRLHPGDHLDVARSLAELVSAQIAGKHFAQAEPAARKALEMFRRLIAGDHRFVARALQELAICLRDAGRAAEAEPFQVESLEMRRRLFPGDHADVSVALFNLATIRQAMGRVAEAVPCFEEALAMSRKLLPAGHADLRSDMTMLATAYYLNGSLEKALPLYEEALKANESALGRQHPETLQAIGNVGACYRRSGRVADALPLLEEAWSHVKQHPASVSFVGPHLLDAYVAMADPAKEGSAAKAMAFFDELLAEGRATLAPESPQLALKLTQLSLRLIDMKAWEKAEPLLREALTIRLRTQPDAWTTFNTTSQLGEALFRQERYAEAESLLLDGYRGMKAREATIEPNGRVRIPQALERLIRFYEATGKESDAAAWRRELDALRSAEGGRR